MFARVAVTELLAENRMVGVGLHDRLAQREFRRPVASVRGSNVQPGCASFRC